MEMMETQEHASKRKWQEKQQSNVKDYLKEQRRGARYENRWKKGDRRKSTLALEEVGASQLDDAGFADT